MNKEQLILGEINEIKNNANKLYSYLYDLFYQGRIKNINFLEGVFSSFLTDERSSIRQIAIYALLFGLRIQKDKYRMKALEFVDAPDSDFDLRLFSLSGLSQAYMNTKDKALLTKFYLLYNSDSEDSDIQATAFTGMLRILGLTTVDISSMNGKVIIAADDINPDVFSKQLIEIRRIIGKE